MQARFPKNPLSVHREKPGKASHEVLEVDSWKYQKENYRKRFKTFFYSVVVGKRNTRNPQPTINPISDDGYVGSKYGWRNFAIVFGAHVSEPQLMNCFMLVNVSCFLHKKLCLLEAMNL